MRILLVIALAGPLMLIGLVFTLIVAVAGFIADAAMSAGEWVTKKINA